MLGAHVCQKRVSDLLKLDLQAAVSCDVGAGNQTRVPWKSSILNVNSTHIHSFEEPVSLIVFVQQHLDNGYGETCSHISQLYFPLFLMFLSTQVLPMFF